MKKIALATAFAMAATTAFADNPAPALMEAPVVPAPEAASSSASGWVLPALLLIALAAAADKIFANKASIVGSIGVVMSGFGFVDAIEKLGIERRLLFSGESKALMDPFMPLGFLEKEHMQKILDKIQYLDVLFEKK